MDLGVTGVVTCIVPSLPTVPAILRPRSTNWFSAEVVELVDTLP